MLLASRGFKVLLIDKALFPRGKVCGCCLSKSSVDGLRQVGLGSMFAKAGAIALESISLFDAASRATLPLNGGFSISRDRFDAELVSSAIASGAQFLPGHQAQVVELGSDLALISVCVKGELLFLNARSVVVADGLSGHALDGIPGFDVEAIESSRIGAGTVLADAPSFYRPGAIYMCCADKGYVGLVLLEDSRLDVACALDREYSRRMNGPGAAAETIIAACNLPVPPSLAQSHWTGTQALTRKRKRIWGRRLFVVGDACGYAEPFTGEGISWAISSAIAAAPFVAQAIGSWNDGIGLSWERTYDASIGRRHRLSNVIALFLRRNRLRRLSISILSRAPALVSPLVRRITGHSVSKVAAAETQDAEREEECQWSQ